MRNIPSLLSMLDKGEAARVIMPWDYVRMRREAARLSHADVARPYWHRPEHQDDVERNVRALEQEGVRGQWNVDLSRAMPFSADIYRQLADLPPHQHPKLCRTCGWDEFTTQYDMTGDDVTWSREQEDICTRCEQIAAQRNR